MWERTPAETGWHWHRYFVDQKPIHNVCWVSVTRMGVFVHYLGEQDQVLVQEGEDEFWGPLIPPD